VTVTVHHGDSREVLKAILDGSIDACVCDPPYALVSIGKRFGKDGAAPAKVGKTGAYARASAGFMGQRWDVGDVAHDPAFWSEVFRVLKPGAHVVAFSGTRTQHRQVCAIEDAGFEIRDQIGWLFGSGFPKSHNQKGDWEGWGSALKPAWEPICLARKPLVGTIVANLDAHGCGALNVDACRVGSERPVSKSDPAKFKAWKQGDGHARQDRNAPDERIDVGRWPANVIHDGSEEVIAAFPEAPGQQADISHTAPSPKTGGIYGKMSREGEASAARRYVDKGATDFAPLPGQRRADSGSAARFFYTAKADAEDRLGSKHPTVKPVDLMAYLCRLVTPPGGVILDPFAGTGTTGLAAMREGFDCILIEREAEYVADIERRLAWARGEGKLTAQEASRAPQKTADDLPLFSGEAA
jgi:site-specific DNA-methyltransferase (adenine-specific)